MYRHGHGHSISKVDRGVLHNGYNGNVLHVPNFLREEQIHSVQVDERENVLLSSADFSIVQVCWVLCGECLARIHKAGQLLFHAHNMMARLCLLQDSFLFSQSVGRGGKTPC